MPGGPGRHRICCMAVPFVRTLDFRYGAATALSPRIRRVIAPNPSAFTFHGTGTYIVGGQQKGGPVAVIDPGPLDDAHLQALLAALDGETVSHIQIGRASCRERVCQYV